MLIVRLAADAEARSDAILSVERVRHLGNCPRLMPPMSNRFKLWSGAGLIALRPSGSTLARSSFRAVAVERSPYARYTLFEILEFVVQLLERKTESKKRSTASPGKSRVRPRSEAWRSPLRSRRRPVD